ncbi:MAG: response regulator [Myxococcota bacterium]
MTPETLARVYEPFFTTKEPGAGTGLRLSTVYAVASALGGRVEARSAPGEGACFSLVVPRAAAGVGQTPTPPLPLMAMPRTAPRVLVVEDQALVRSVVVRVLEGLGCVVAEADGAEPALAWLDAQEMAPDLVITDIVMPGATGVELAERIRARDPAARILGMSGWMGDDALANRLEELGVPLLRKPFPPRELARLVTELLALDAASG